MFPLVPSLFPRPGNSISQCLRGCSHCSRCSPRKLQKIRKNYQPSASRSTIRQNGGKNSSAGRAGAVCFRNGCDDSTGVGFLLMDFAEWCAARDVVPCRRATIELLLQDAGIPLRDGVAAGLVPKVDLEAVESS